MVGAAAVRLRRRPERAAPHAAAAGCRTAHRLGAPAARRPAGGGLGAGRGRLRRPGRDQGAAPVGARARRRPRAAVDGVRAGAGVRVGAGGRRRAPAALTHGVGGLRATLATTNASWARTRAVLTRLVDTLGPAGPAGERAFPSPRAVAAAGVDHLRDTVKLGYRAPALAGLAAAVAHGVVDPGSWRDPARS